MQECIPISQKDVHKFIAEITQENLFLINVNNETTESKERMMNQSNADAIRLK